MYFVKAPTLLKKLYPEQLIWKIDTHDSVYLTFDDGPHPVATAFALQQLALYNAKATFFCIGKNVAAYPDLYKQIIDSGHSIGNHTQNHLNGWKVKCDQYLENIVAAQKYIESNLFRPPYGRITKKQANAINKQGMKIVMWDLLCGDFDPKIDPEKCWENISNHISPGSIIVFHDSSKAWEKMSYTLPLTLALCKEKNWNLKSL